MPQVIGRFAEPGPVLPGTFGKAVSRQIHKPPASPYEPLHGLAAQEIDLEFVKCLVRRTVPFVLVLTKTDNVSVAMTQANIAAFTDRISAWFEKFPEEFTCSAETGCGRQELLGVIGEQMTAISGASSRALVLLHAEDLLGSRFSKGIRRGATVVSPPGQGR